MEIFIEIVNLPCKRQNKKQMENQVVWRATIIKEERIGSNERNVPERIGRVIKATIKNGRVIKLRINVTNARP